MFVDNVSFFFCTDNTHIACFFAWLGGTQRAPAQGLRMLDDLPGYALRIRVYGRARFGRTAGARYLRSSLAAVIPPCRSTTLMPPPSHPFLHWFHT